MFSNKFQSEQDIQEDEELDDIELTAPPKHDFAKLHEHLQKRIGASNAKVNYAAEQSPENYDFEEPSARIEHETPVEIEFIDEVKKSEEIEPEEEEDVILFIEYKYCTVCHIEQPLRCKHCKQCDQCVATFDHHCPWLANCIGERNKKVYFAYLWVQFF